MSTAQDLTAEKAYRLACRLAARDGTVGPTEKELLERLAAALGLSEQVAAGIQESLAGTGGGGVGGGAMQVRELFRKALHLAGADGAIGAGEREVLVRLGTGLGLDGAEVGAEIDAASPAPPSPGKQGRRLQVAMMIGLLVYLGVQGLVESLRMRRENERGLAFVELAGVMGPSFIMMADRGRARTTYYAVVVRYRYDYRGVSYEATRHNLHGDTIEFGNLAEAQAELAKRPEGQPVRVFVDPVAPEVAVLDREHIPDGGRMVRSAIALVVAGILGVALWLRLGALG